MSEKLIPLALSSQIDNNGLEHIHASPFTNVSGRPIWIGLIGDLLDGDQGEVVNYEFNVVGGTEPYETASILSGMLPDGLSLDLTDIAEGIVRVIGTRSTAGVYPFTVSATDSESNVANLDDSSETFSKEIYDWRLESISTQNTFSCYVDEDVIGVGHANGLISYSLDRWQTHNTVDVGDAGIYGMVKYQGDWYAIGSRFGSGFLYKATGDSFSFSSIGLPFHPGQFRQLACVIDDYIYCGQNTSPNLVVWRFDGTNWISYNTGITVRGVNEVMNSGTRSGNTYLFGTNQGRVIRTTDFVNFTVAITDATSTNVSVATVGNRVAAVLDTANGLTYISTDNGDTFPAPYNFNRVVAANGWHFMSAGSTGASTSFTGESGSWTVRLASAFQPSVAFAGRNLAIMTQGTSGSIMIGETV